MKTIVLGLSLLLGMVYFSFGQDNNHPKIKAVKGFLYYNQNNGGGNCAGTLSENIIDNKNFSSWNGSGGTGSINGDSQNLLVVVEIINNSMQESGNGYIKLTIFDETSKVIFLQIQSYMLLDIKNVFYAPFMLNHPGCGIIKLKAELLNNSKDEVFSAMVKMIDFKCGE